MLVGVRLRWPVRGPLAYDPTIAWTVGDTIESLWVPLASKAPPDPTLEFTSVGEGCVEEIKRLAGVPELLPTVARASTYALVDPLTVPSAKSALPEIRPPPPPLALASPALTRVAWTVIAVPGLSISAPEAMNEESVPSTAELDDTKLPAKSRPIVTTLIEVVAVSRPLVVTMRLAAWFRVAPKDALTPPWSLASASKRVTEMPPADAPSAVACALLVPPALTAMAPPGSERVPPPTLAAELAVLSISASACAPATANRPNWRGSEVAVAVLLPVDVTDSPVALVMLPFMAAEAPLAISALDSATPTPMSPPPPPLAFPVPSFLAFAETVTSPPLATVPPSVACTPAVEPILPVAPPPPRLTPNEMAVTSVTAEALLGPTAVTLTDPDLVTFASRSAVTGASISALEEMPVPAKPRPMLVADAVTLAVWVWAFTPPEPSGVPVSASTFTTPFAPMLPPPAPAWMSAYFVITAST